MMANKVKALLKIYAIKDEAPCEVYLTNYKNSFYMDITVPSSNTANVEIGEEYICIIRKPRWYDRIFK